MREVRSYSAEERAEAVALAASIGPKRAGIKLGIPIRTVASWMHTPAASVVIARVEASIAERLRAAHEEALDAVLEGLRDKRTRLGERARALEVLGTQLQLAEGRATANIEVHGQSEQDDDAGPPLTEAERAELRGILAQTLAEYEANEGA